LSPVSFPFPENPDHVSLAAAPAPPRESHSPSARCSPDPAQPGAAGRTQPTQLPRPGSPGPYPAAKQPSPHRQAPPRGQHPGSAHRERVPASHQRTGHRPCLGERQQSSGGTGSRSRASITGHHPRLSGRCRQRTPGPSQLSRPRSGQPPTDGAFPCRDRRAATTGNQATRPALDFGSSRRPPAGPRSQETPNRAGHCERAGSPSRACQTGRPQPRGREIEGRPGTPDIGEGFARRDDQVPIPNRANRSPSQGRHAPAGGCPFLSARTRRRRWLAGSSSG
jgi:translation initiation factor IF-2